MDPNEFADAVAEILRGFLEREVDPIVQRLAAIEARLAEPSRAAATVDAVKGEVQAMRGNDRLAAAAGTAGRGEDGGGRRRGHSSDQGRRHGRR